jgi:D-alanyl-D-alanine carboxypeptidase/D-alanyl-D-alanine-endopeptidase (penicillin-binding protein 4)
LLVAASVLLAGTVVALTWTGLITQETSGPTPSPSSETPSPTPSPVPTVLAAASASPTPGAPDLEDVLGPALAADALGEQVGAAVVDLATGVTLMADDADVALIPASTLKIMTAAAALDVLGPEHRFATRVVEGAAPGEIVLVGGGDPSLTVADQPRPAVATQLVTLADLTAAALTESGTTTVRLLFDDGLFTGPAVSPDWRPAYVPSGAVGPVTALAVDGGRITPGLRRRAADPALSAATSFASLLAARGITVTGTPARGDAAGGAAEIAGVRSAPLAAIVEHVLLVSDNDGAEVLARHVALGSGRRASFRDAGPAILDAVGDLGVDVSDAVVLDGSGLARGNALPPAVVAATLAAAADPDRPELRAVLTGLPVAAFTGTLDDRFDSPATGAGVGVVRAKTGTLNGVSSLAGTVVSRDGTAYGFAVLADNVPNNTAAEVALDDVAALLAGCGCAHPATAG